LFSTIVWNFGGLDLIGFVAGEVQGGKNGFLRGVTGALPLILANYMVPIFIGFLVDNDYHNWQTGHFVKLTENYFSEEAGWLVPWMRAGTCVGVFGTQLSSATTSSRLIWAMAKGNEDNIAQYRYLPRFFSWSWTHNRILRPVAAILTNGILTLGLSAFPIDYLMKSFLLLRITNLLFEYAALIYLRFSEPETPRPFEIPYGKAGVIVCFIPTVIFSVLAVVTSDWLIIALGSGVIVASGLLFVFVYVAKLVWVKLVKWRLNFY